MRLEAARAADLSAITALLADSRLAGEDFAAHQASCLVGRHRGRVVAAGALELHGECGLLRSVVVARAGRRRGWGRRVTQRLLDLARSVGLSEVYLLTETAVAFFAGCGFAPASRDLAPEAIRQTRQFAKLCPATATLMRINL